MTPTAALSPRALAEQYLDAWQRHDLDAVLELHAEDSTFTSVATGRTATGRQRVREAIAQVFAVWPDLRFHPIRVYATAQVIVAENILEATRALALPLRGKVIQPSGRKVSCAVADVLALEGGLVKRKDCYLDALHYVAQMESPE